MDSAQQGAPSGVQTSSLGKPSASAGTSVLSSQPTSSLPLVLSGVSVEESSSFIQSGLNLPPSTPIQKIAHAGLASHDLEIVRRALHVSSSVGLQGSAEFKAAEERLRADRAIPADWSMATYVSGKYLEGSSGGRQSSTVVAYERQPASVVEEIQGMFDATYRKVYTRDRRGAPIPDRFKIVSVHRVFNDQVWREYSKRREEVRQRVVGTRPVVPDGVQTMEYLSKRSSTLGNGKVQIGLPKVDEAVNEAWLFHGTTKEAAQGIAENDFRLDLTGSNAGTLYGKGIYLAENATKSDEYGEGPRGPAGEQEEQGYEAPRPPPGPPPPLVRESYILLCRSTLGKVYYTDDLKPDADELQRRALSGEYDSVVGDRLKRVGTFRELIVYHDDLVYPEYIVHYERVFFHDRFAEIYSAMCKRKNKGTFKGPTKDETDVLTSMWNVYGMPNKGKINKWQLLDLLTAIKQPPQNEGEDLDATFGEWDTNSDGWITCEEFLQEMTQRVNDGIVYYQ